MHDNDLSVLVVSPPTSVWGAQLYLLETVEPLAERGVSLTLATPAGSPFAQTWQARSLPLLDLPIVLPAGLRLRDGSGRRPGPRSLGRDAANATNTVRLLRPHARRYDILHSYSLRTHLDVAIAGRLSKRPVVLDLVDIVRPGIGRKVLRFAARLATLTVANSHATAATLGTGRRSRVIQPGIDLDRFQPGSRSDDLRCELTTHPDRPLVAIIGRIDPLKGVQTLVQAMTRLEGEAARAHLVVVGEAGTGRPEFASQLRDDAKARLGDRVIFTGKRSDIPEVLRNVDILVNASMAEPFGLTVLEAQACGTPIVATNAGGIPEFVTDNVTGLLVPPFEVDALTRALTRLLVDPDLGRGLAEEALRRVPSRGLAVQYDDLADMYRSVVKAY